ncbi:MAG: hypothetical protein D6805_02245 [Planctomycetota bacterium]|nr:MAG: hypothetical protein D6805_02245 [Planctomycetota bacterium]
MQRATSSTRTPVLFSARESETPDEPGRAWYFAPASLPGFSAIYLLPLSTETLKTPHLAYFRFMC